MILPFGLSNSLDKTHLSLVRIRNLLKNTFIASDQNVWLSQTIIFSHTTYRTFACRTYNSRTDIFSQSWLEKLWKDFDVVDFLLKQMSRSKVKSSQQKLQVENTNKKLS